MDIRGRKMRKPPACVQCRRRKIGCDRVKPVCGNCNKSGKYDCFFPDVPGMYTPSVSNYERKTTPKVVKTGSVGTLGGHHARESLLHKNEQQMGLKALEQMRDYNTRLQLLNAQTSMDMNMGGNSYNYGGINSGKTNDYGTAPGSADNNVFIPAGYEDYQLLMSYYGTPAEFDLMKSRYSQEELLIKEMEFLEEKVIELSELYKDNQELDRLNEDIKRDRVHKSSYMRKENEDELVFKNLLERSRKQLSKKMKLEKDSDKKDNAEENQSEDSNDEEFNDDSNDDEEDETNYEDYTQNNNVDKFKVINPEFLQKSEIFSIPSVVCVNNELNPVLPLKDNRNRIFDKPFLIYRDKHLTRFYNKLNQLNNNQFEKQFRDLQTKRSTTSFLLKTITTFKLPDRMLTQEMINKYNDLVKVSSSMIPVLKSKNELLASIEKLFATSSQFVISEQSIEQLLNLFNINMCLLLTFESLSSTVLIPLKEEELKNYEELKNWVPTLKANMEYTKSELESRKNYESIEVLKAMSLYKFYRMISSDYNSMVDFDEDVYLARKLSLNSESKNAEVIILWNFIFKNYCLRHLFRGETPNLVTGLELNSSIVIDPLLANNVPLLTFQMEMVSYLHLNDSLISMEKIKKLKQKYKFQLNEANKRSSDTASILQNVIDSTIYRNSVLLLDFYEIIQYELLGEVDLFEATVDGFLKLIQESLFYAFSNLANLKFAGFEFLFSNFSFILLDNICHMILSLYQRTSFAISKLVDENDLAKKEILTTQLETLKILLYKFMMLLDDYKKNLKYVDQNITKIISKMKVIIEYLEVKTSIQNRENDEFIDVLSKIDITKLKNINEKINSISESLIKNDFYAKRDKYTPKDSQNLGITVESYDSAITAFFS